MDKGGGIDEGGGKESCGGVGKEVLAREKAWTRRERYEIRYWRVWGRAREQCKRAIDVAMQWMEALD
jgi:hypothetical protein